ncbi:hypothetical protein BC833DRAFT_599755 [Globomyces pollinis-pini]|nr:hypothetical protein BC833DRAFT_599755 [Globomyces pollinis-pini]
MMNMNAEQTSTKIQFLKSFEDGDGDMFFALWEDHIESNLSDNEEKNIEILLSVYFAIYPILFDQPVKLEKSMDKFKKFLELRGGEWSTEPQFLQYYALPYLPDPKCHPTFKSLFDMNWHMDLKLQLDQFLSTKIPIKIPALISLLKNEPLLNRVTQEQPVQNPDIDKQLQMMRDELLRADQKEAKLNQKLQLIRKDYHQLISVSSELVQTLIAAINQEQIDPSYLADIVKRLGSLKDDRSISRASTHKTVEFEHSPTNTVSVPVEKNTIHKPSITLPPLKSQLLLHLLDFPKIQNELLQISNNNDDIHHQILLIKSLRMLLEKCTIASKRRATLENLIQQDFIGMKKMTLIPHLLRHTNTILREQCSKLINMLSTDCIGRGYLLSEQAWLVKDIIHALKSESFDSVFRQNLLGSLQKLSLRRVAQSMMNETKMFSFLCKLFEEENETLSEYSIEYGSALCMNLCLRTSGRREACQDPERTLSVLTNLMDHSNIQVKTYVNGCLYSLFADANMRAHAHSIGLVDQLQCVREIGDESLAKQIDFVIEKLTIEEEEEEDIDDSFSEDGEEEDNVEDDEDEVFENDEDDSEIIKKGDLVGDELLEKYYITQTSRVSPKPQPNFATKTAARAAEKQKRNSGEEFSPKLLQSMQIQLPVLEKTQKGRLNMPISKEEKEEFNFGFSTRPKLPRTPTIDV